MEESCKTSKVINNVLFILVNILFWIGFGWLIANIVINERELERTDNLSIYKEKFFKNENYEVKVLRICPNFDDTYSQKSTIYIIETSLGKRIKVWTEGFEVQALDGESWLVEPYLHDSYSGNVKFIKRLD